MSCRAARGAREQSAKQVEQHVVQLRIEAVVPRQTASSRGWTLVQLKLDAVQLDRGAAPGEQIPVQPYPGWSNPERDGFRTRLDATRGKISGANFMLAGVRGRLAILEPK